MNHLILLILPLWESISLTSCILGAARVLVRTKRIFLLRRNKNMSPTDVSWSFMAAFLHLRGFCRWSSIAHWRQGFRVWTRYRLWRPIQPSFFAFFFCQAGRWKGTPFSPQDLHKHRKWSVLKVEIVDILTSFNILNTKKHPKFELIHAQEMPAVSLIGLLIAFSPGSSVKWGVLKAWIWSRSWVLNSMGFTDFCHPQNSKKYGIGKTRNRNWVFFIKVLF